MGPQRAGGVCAYLPDLLLPLPAPGGAVNVEREGVSRAVCDVVVCFVTLRVV